VRESVERYLEALAEEAYTASEYSPL